MKRGLAVKALEKKFCFENVVAHAKWLAEFRRAQQRKVSPNLAAATAGIDFAEEAYAVAARSTWNSSVVAVWQWGGLVPAVSDMGEEVRMQNNFALFQESIVGW